MVSLVFSGATTHQLDTAQAGMGRGPIEGCSYWTEGKKREREGRGRRFGMFIMFSRHAHYRGRETVSEGNVDLV
ncbi:hypothetical protein E2C01_047647 [Portunus trituberculatus]|uniref:Uncharacterized protein n=1 Tax=Portunus trituberculatus TaxID=210409 RepID=A0A5B7G9F5_PORTR|nr:hypothetical protein [Portunus trituberculatus]